MNPAPLLEVFKGIFDWVYLRKSDIVGKSLGEIIQNSHFGTLLSLKVSGVKDGKGGKTLILKCDNPNDLFNASLMVNELKKALRRILPFRFEIKLVRS